MATWCSITDIRNTDKRLSKSTEISDAAITERITSAQDIIKVDLSPMATESDLDSAGASSKTLKILTIFKTTEITLAMLFGNFRQGEDVSDIDYFKNKYDSLIQKILSGDVVIYESLTTTAKDSPSTGAAVNQSFYSEKGIQGFYPDDDSNFDTVRN